MHSDTTGGTPAGLLAEFPFPNAIWFRCATRMATEVSALIRILKMVCRRKFALRPSPFAIRHSSFSFRPAEAGGASGLLTPPTRGRTWRRRIAEIDTSSNAQRTATNSIFLRLGAT
jgi:hypothetical protein